MTGELEAILAVREKFERVRPPSIEEEDPVKAGREGQCDMVAEMLLDFYPEAKFYRLTDEKQDGFDHVFLMLGAKALDIGGFTTVESLTTLIQSKGEILVVKPTTLEEIRNNFKYHRSKDEARRYACKFRAYIKENPQLFPPDNHFDSTLSGGG